jgi:hypothetical protein
MALALGVFTLGINWGLPSRAVDPFLFGEQQPWSGKQIIELLGDRTNATQGADVDPNPTEAGSILNLTDAQRAEIALRYRLYTYQPDENITMKALASMKPAKRDFDPKLYQYGGLWIYPVGALIRVSVNPQSQEYYLDRPEEFGRFYLVARLYVVLWGLVGVWAVFRIAHDCGAGAIGATGAALLYMLMPVVVNMSHEAKPHLPGAVLMLLAAMSAGKFVASGRARWWIVTGALCGMSMGMVLTGMLAFVMLPIMVLMRPMNWRGRYVILISAPVIGVIVYFATNPYVLIHLLGDPTVLHSNLSNSKAMYEVARVGEGFINAMRLVWEGATPLILVVGLIGGVVAQRIAKPQAAALRILIIVSVVIVVQFIALAAGKPGEYGRFALVPSIVLALCCAVLFGRARIRTFEKVESLALLVILAMLPSVIYLYGFVRDSGAASRRLHYARLIEQLRAEGAQTLGIERDPAPYRLPPVDLFRWTILKLPTTFDLTSSEAVTDVIVRPVDVMPSNAPPSRAYRRLNGRDFDDVFPARISWADKPLEIWVRKELTADR